MNPHWTTELRPVESLSEWAENPRKITSEQFEKLKDSIRKYGFHDVIKIDTDGTIVSGHQRKRALQELGIKMVWTMTPDRALTPQERQAIAIESNLHRGVFDFDILASNFELPELLEYGFNEKDLLGSDFAPTKPEEKKEEQGGSNSDEICPECGQPLPETA